MSMDIPRLAEHAYWVHRHALKVLFQPDHPYLVVPPPWEDLPDYEKQSWCEAVTEVLHRAG